MYAADAWREDDGGLRYDGELGAWVALKHAIWEDDKLEPRPGSPEITFVVL